MPQLSISNETISAEQINPAARGTVMGTASACLLVFWFVWKLALSLDAKESLPVSRVCLQIFKTQTTSFRTTEVNRNKKQIIP